MIKTVHNWSAQRIALQIEFTTYQNILYSKRLKYELCLNNKMLIYKFIIVITFARTSSKSEVKQN